MSFWNKLKANAASIQKGLADEVTKFKNDAFMHAVTAGCAMMASADGEISSSEKQKMVGFIQNSDALKVFDLQKVIASFNAIVTKFEFDRTIGEGEALALVSKIKGKPEARIVVAVVLAVANADGNFDPKEREVARKIASAAAVDPAEFNI
ncbi:MULTISPECIES: tellurite resistance TerB family protein [unclassified Azospirillum]|uniref:tellurite resistance TerB family protein n=1 Tax=unclassified Azospirillum TaxID=2630922 RepID=UPI000B6C527A|nr:MULTISPECIES: TerB family tellurite resistance protein [unclassified Azospirillum]SNT21099.1 tellurite resistance protein TerB [Azospirillum sp. RU38E]SNT32777.1 tellurite resistance protein TerB [Azospirillum sp. RU37A]